ncbi:MAG: hypothetical protein AAAC48_29650 [Phyllobacterium sp.]|uniref:hypothetical protein n=1 Tax=Phyllobacterium sp. TaxID=1871046 RepID=UPI0030EFAA6F
MRDIPRASILLLSCPGAHQYTCPQSLQAEEEKLVSAQEPNLENLRKSALAGNIKAWLVLALLIHVPALTPYFWQGWLYLVVFGSCALWVTLYFLKHDPALVASRQKAGAGAEREKSQKWIQGVASVVGGLMFVVPGIERHFTGLPLPVWTVILADIPVVVGFWIIFLALREMAMHRASSKSNPARTLSRPAPIPWCGTRCISAAWCFSWRRRLHSVRYGLCRLQSHWYLYWLFDCLTKSAI